ncbi:MAG: PCRF domain-containing protein [Candidatus Paceibacterota bacterium]|jgi:peptide chain release factor 2
MSNIQLGLITNILNNKLILSIYPGAGGKEAEDWALMLLRMYQKYSEKKKWKFAILDKKEDEYGGIKNATVEITGENVYEILKNENGVHRLVRISPFSSAHLRHTSFALVEALPIIEAREIPIEDEDLEIKTFRSSGPGGQNVQKVETAVRIKHKPTEIIASCQSERSQSQNKEKALGVLRGKLYQLSQQEKAQTIGELKGKKIKIEWGNQIRSYVLHPYKMVRNEKTGKKWSNIVEEVLNGDLDKII